jgi:FeS assembly SUF system protein
MAMPAEAVFDDQREFANLPYCEGTSHSPLEGPVIEALRTVFDPEIPVSIFDLGLIYDIRFDGSAVHIVMTLTAPSCPVAEEIPKWVQEAVRQVPGVTAVTIELVWDPFWKPEYMTEAARLMLGLL